MVEKFKAGDLALYKRQDVNENTFVIILKSMFFDNSGIEYFRCLVDGRKENICEIWIKKINLK